MKIFIGNPLNALEFIDTNLILSTSGWLLNNQADVVGILNKEYIEIYIENEKTYLSKENRFLYILDFLVTFGFDKDVLNFDFYFLSLLNKTDLIIFSTYFSENVLKKVFMIIQSNLRKVNIPTIVINSIDKIPKIFYIVPNYQNDFLIKDSIYLYSEFKKKGQYFQTFGKYLLDLKETLSTFKVTVRR
ncbi:MAG TPA: hypothetical protein PK894_01515 [Defluviitoga sp.]|nr:hypothetical protein [Defluviitoga sp.]HOP25173.1 hypothetical protein [Defluviitoga sp.]HPZ28373.1 hypothetical protein [Defluviitoga sp.]HQD62263.1 hypothetical protein [Defluviitoga sp.]